MMNTEVAMKWLEAKMKLARLRYEMLKRYGWLVYIWEAEKK